MTSGAEPRSSDAATPTASPATAGRKPRFALFIATACGLGYLPKAPGTFGSLAGLLAAMFPLWAGLAIVFISGGFGVWGVDNRETVNLIFYSGRLDPVFIIQVLLTLIIAAIGVWSAARAAHFWQQRDPQRVVIDEVSGQHLTLLLGLAIPVWWRPSETVSYDYTLGLVSFHSALNWKYLLLGLILFRVFDIWKPFPARQAES
ncbi:MAG: phosphatidylglycerophosphatase A, partial [Candidatus Acidiferrales bacterium]